MTKERTYSRQAVAAAQLLGQQIKLGRKQRRWTELNLAERAGISRATLRKIEQGDMGCALGLVFEVATLVGIRLFDLDRAGIAEQIDHTQDKLTLLPQRVRAINPVVDDDF